MKVTDTDRGASYLIKRAAEMANRVKLSVGVPENAGQYPDGTDVSKVAAVHEFGLGTAPPRSFIRGWFDGKGAHYFGVRLAEAAQESLMQGTSFDALLQELGAQYVAQVRERMDAHISPELQDATVRRKRAKGSSTPETPLEDTHRLRAAIVAKVSR